MMKRLKIDPAFTPCPVKDGDELFPNGIFEFNITALLAHLESHPEGVTVVDIAVSDLDHSFTSFDESYVESADITRPVVLAEISPGRFNLIDGHHRVEKALRHDIATLRANKLTVLQHIAFLTSNRAYLSYVEYWNGKIAQCGEMKRAEQRRPRFGRQKDAPFVMT